MPQLFLLESCDAMQTLRDCVLSTEGLPMQAICSAQVKVALSVGTRAGAGSSLMRTPLGNPTNIQVQLRLLSQQNMY